VCVSCVRVFVFKKYTNTDIYYIYICSRFMEQNESQDENVMKGNKREWCAQYIYLSIYKIKYM